VPIRAGHRAFRNGNSSTGLLCNQIVTEQAEYRFYRTSDDSLIKTITISPTSSGAAAPTGQFIPAGTYRVEIQGVGYGEIFDDGPYTVNCGGTLIVNRSISLIFCDCAGIDTSSCPPCANPCGMSVCACE